MPDRQDVPLPGLRELAEIVEPVAQRFADAGHRLYLVGGIVRDLTLAQSDNPASHPASQSSAPGDIDLTTDADPATIKNLVGPLAEALWTQGERFGTIGATVAGRDLEITTHRAESYDPASRKPVVTFGTDLDEDLSRRDFTINAMAIELPNQVLHDPYHGADDLAAGLLRTPLSPEISFTDDPLRIMRAARFLARFGFKAAPELVDAAAEYADRLAIVSVERIADELERLLATTDPGPGLRFLADINALPISLPDNDNDNHTDNDNHNDNHNDKPNPKPSPSAVDVAVELASAVDHRAARRAGLLWPLDEPVASAEATLKRLRYSRADTVRTTNLLRATMAGLTAEPPNAATVRSIAALVGVEDLTLVTGLVAAIVDNDPRWQTRKAQAEAFNQLVFDVSTAEDLSDLGSPLSGSAIIETLGIEPGPIVGRAQRHLTDLRIERGPLSEAEARTLLTDWWHHQQAADR